MRNIRAERALRLLYGTEAELRGLAWWLRFLGFDMVPEAFGFSSESMWQIRKKNLRRRIYSLSTMIILGACGNAFADPEHIFKPCPDAFKDMRSEADFVGFGNLRNLHNVEHDGSSGGAFSVHLKKFFAGRSTQAVIPTEVEVDGLPLLNFSLPVSPEGGPANVIWSPVRGENPSRGGPNTLIRLAGGARNNLKNPDELLPNLGINFMNGIHPEGVSFRFHLRTSISEQFAKKLGRDVWYEAEFSGPKGRAIDWSDLHLR